MEEFLIDFIKEHYQILASSLKISVKTFFVFCERVYSFIQTIYSIFYYSFYYPIYLTKLFFEYIVLFFIKPRTLLILFFLCGLLSLAKTYYKFKKPKTGRRRPRRN